MVAAARAEKTTLLIAPTGGGKTLAGFLPTLIELSGLKDRMEGVHTLYISPLKALAVDVHRNLLTPIAEMELDITAETRTGDTPQAKRQRQKTRPPNILMTTPESLALLLSYPEAPQMFSALRCVIIDELHAIAGNKRGDLLSLGLSRLQSLAPRCRRVGLSATVADETWLTHWISPTASSDDGSVQLVRGGAAAEAQIEILTTQERLPWSGHMAVHALAEVYQRIKDARTTLVFVNTRAQAEIVFHELWRLNEDALPIALHHGSLSVEQRRKVEAAMARGALRAVVATSSLDLGIDWAAIDLVVQVGAPKGASRLIQRIGRANHRLTEPSKALLVPANRFEVLECQAAVDAIGESDLDGDVEQPGALDVLAQHILGMACSGPLNPTMLYAEITRAGAYRTLKRADFDDALRFVENGGYALGTYDRWNRLRQDENGDYVVVNKDAVRRYRMNIGTIVEAATLKVRLNRGRVLGEIEEYFLQGLQPGDTFMFAGELLRFIGIKDMTAMVARGGDGDPKVPAYAGGRLPLTTNLARRVRTLLSDPSHWSAFPDAVREWLRLQNWRSVMPSAGGLLVETFPRGGKEWLIAYCFEGRNAHQTLGMLLTRRMERMGVSPLGFVATDYVIAVWSVRPVQDINALFEQDMLGDDLESWMDESSMLKRTFRNVAIVAGLIERRLPGHEKTGRQVTFNADLIYDVLRRHEPDHILLRATRADAATGLTDVGRLADMLIRVQGKITHRRLDRVSPLAVPVMLEVGREQVYGSGIDDILDEAAEDLIADACEGFDTPELPL